MTTSERLLRAISFYSAAIPVFASYKLLEQKLKLNPTTKEDEELQYQALHEWGSELITEKVKDLKGFYVKTGQIISTRVDIFPIQYTSKLAVTLDALDPVPAQVIVDIVRQELLEGGELSELFAEFDPVPLGSASIAQVHKAKLLDGRTVAVKVQRPGIDAKLLADVGNLKTFALAVRDTLPVDYYKIFCELERTLTFELDFFHEAQSAQKVAAAVAHSPANRPHTAAVIVPLPLPGLVSRRVLVMEFVDGVALSKLSEEMKKRGVAEGSPEAKLFGRKLLSSLTDAYASMIFGSGIVHGDPHPGNIFVTEAGDVALLDCGQVKQLTGQKRRALAQLLVLVNRWESIDKEAAEAADEEEPELHADLIQKREILTAKVAAHMVEQGIEFAPDAGPDCAIALALLLFGNSDAVLPGGYEGQELSAASPIAKVVNFPSEFILLGRATVMIKGIARRVGVEWGLSDRWSAYARETLGTTDPSEFLPIWSVASPQVASTAEQQLIGSAPRGRSGVQRFSQVIAAFKSSFVLLKEYVVSKLVQLGRKWIPEATQKRLIQLVVKTLAYWDSMSSRKPVRPPAEASLASGSGSQK